jgi:uncharacterized circularly permuted ATP-grasp superfamily protein
MADLFSSAPALTPEAGSSPEPKADALIRGLQDRLENLPPDQLARIFSLAEEFREEDGAYLGARDSLLARNWEENGTDLMPFILEGEEWARLQAGLIQRIRAWNCFLRDIYTGQEILKADVVPYELVFTDPNFHRGCARLTAVMPHYLQLTAFDLQRTARGQWMVVEDHLGVAEGATYALKKRQVMRQTASRLFDGIEILPIDDFAIQVMDVLQEWVRKPAARGECCFPAAAATSIISITPRWRGRWASPSCRAATWSCSTAVSISKPSRAWIASMSSCAACPLRSWIR